MKQLSYTLSVICLLMIGAVWVRAQTLGPAGGVLISGGSFTSGDVVCGAGGASIQDCGTLAGTIGNLTVASSTFVNNGIYAPQAGHVGLTANSSEIIDLGTSGSHVVASIGSTGQVNSTDSFDIRQTLNAGVGMTIYNLNAGVSAQSIIYLGNGTSATEASLILNGGSFSGGHGANALTVTSAGNFWVTGGSTDAFEVDSSGNPYLPSLANATTAKTGSVCWNTGGGALTYDNTNTCLVSSARFKTGIQPLKFGLKELLKLKPVTFRYTDNISNPGEHVGFTAENVKSVIPMLAVDDEKGKPLKVRYIEMVALLAHAIQEQQREIEQLKHR